MAPDTRTPTVTVEGTAIPAIGIGTWQLRGDQCARIVAEALRVGYRHVDTAQGYANEAEVGEALAGSGIPRDDVFVTTKVRPELTGDGDLQRSVEDSLRRLRIDVVDLVLIHWPNPRVPVEETVRALSDARRRGLTRHIGLSNFTLALLEEAVRVAPEPIVVNQIEYHPLLDQRKLLGAHRRLGIATTAYCPIALGRVIGNPVIEAIAARHGRTPAQVSLRWLIQQDNVIAIPKTARPERLPENLAVTGFELSDDEMAELAALGGRRHLVNEPAWVAEWD